MSAAWIRETDVSRIWDRLGEALRIGLAERTRPTVLDIVVTRDPRMLHAVDDRTVEIKQGDRLA
jgi:acetolactate synthase-1/2/3 large subunit